MDVLRSRKIICLHCFDFIWCITIVTFLITFPQVNFRIQHLIIRKVILIEFTKLFECGLPINISQFFFALKYTSGMMYRPSKVFKFFSENLAFKSFSRCSVTGIVNDLLWYSLEYLMADLLCLFALNWILVLSVIHFVNLQLIWPPYITFRGNHQYYVAC